jgi:SAM-dependent methyltransferase
MGTEIIHTDLPSLHFEPRLYDVGAWTPHLPFAYDLVAALKPRVLVELGVDRGESYFAFCQSAAENKTGTRCFGVDTWRGDQHAGGYDETTFAQVSAHNRTHYEAFSTLIRASFEDALEKFEADSIDLLHVDGLHTESASRHDIDSWMPKVRPGGIILLHDVNVRGRDFGVWKVWAALQERGRSWTFQDGPGLGVWQKPPGQELPGFLEQLIAPPNERNSALAQYYSERAAEMQREIAEEWRTGTIRHRPFAQQTIIQAFYTKDGTHCEEDSVLARVGHDEWKEIRIEFPLNAEASPLRIDFVSPLTTIDVTLISLTKSGHTYFSAPDKTSFDSIALSGDVERVDHPKALRLKITGVDPQLYLPVVALPASDEPLVLHLRLRVSAT